MIKWYCKTVDHGYMLCIYMVAEANTPCGFYTYVVPKNFLLQVHITNVKKLVIQPRLMESAA